MSPSAVPERFSAVTPSLVVSPCDEAIDFYMAAFGAEEIEPRMTGPDGLIGHAEISIEGCVILLGDEWPDGPTTSPRSLGGSTGALFIYTADADAMWQRALAAGATEVFPLELQFYGDKAGRIEDPFGHTWGIGQHVEDVSPEEMERRMASFYEDLPD
jgi:PhnB protein